jgi:hypothetical protein
MAYVSLDVLLFLSEPDPVDPYLASIIGLIDPGKKESEFGTDPSSGFGHRFGTK